MVLGFSSGFRIEGFGLKISISWFRVHALGSRAKFSIKGLMVSEGVSGVQGVRRFL